MRNMLKFSSESQRSQNSRFYTSPAMEYLRQAVYSCRVNLLRTGKVPGTAASKYETQVLAGELKVVGALENILDLALIWACTSSPITLSQTEFLPTFLRIFLFLSMVVWILKTSSGKALACDSCLQVYRGILHFLCRRDIFIASERWVCSYRHGEYGMHFCVKDIMNTIPQVFHVLIFHLEIYIFFIFLSKIYHNYKCEIPHCPTVSIYTLSLHGRLYSKSVFPMQK